MSSTVTSTTPPTSIAETTPPSTSYTTTVPTKATTSLSSPRSTTDAPTTVVMKMGILEQKNCVRSLKSVNSKIPPYAQNYKREYQFIRGINKEFKYIKDFMDNPRYFFNSNKLDRIMKFIKRFLKAQKNGRLKDISNFEFEYIDIENLYEIKKDIVYYYSIIQNYYDWSRGLNDESLVCRYEIYKNDLDLFFSKLNIEIEYSDDDSCDDYDDYDDDYDDDDYDIVFPDSDDDRSDYSFDGYDDDYDIVFSDSDSDLFLF